MQGSVSLDRAVNSSVRCAFDQGESRAFPADIHGKAAVDSVFTADTPRLFTVTAENGNITGFSLTVAGDDCSAWQRLRTPDDKTVILRIPENVTGTLQLNHLTLVLIALAAFVVFRLLSGRLIPENGVDGVFLADGLFILCVTTALFVLRAVQLGLSVADLDSLEYGAVIDLMTESGNDSEKYLEVANQDDFDRF